MASHDEPLDVVNPATGERLETLPRGRVHDEGHWHEVFHCMVVRPSSRGLVFQKRSASKAAFPGKLDLSATGHLESGETPLEGRRELLEELGLDVTEEDLIPVGVRLLADDNGEGGNNRERVHLYFVADETPLDAFVPAEDEVDGLVEIPAEELLRILHDRAESTTAQTWNLVDPPGPAEITRDDLVVGESGYWVIIAVMAQRFLNGETLLAC